MIRLGLIGANADRGWAAAAHVPAIRAVGALELAAVATRSQASADEAATAFGVARAFGDTYAMIRDPHIDVVSVVVKAPAHHDLVLAATAAGKAVYCEWPLGVDLTQAEAMADAASAAGVATAIGLQGRSSPWLRRLKHLVADGYVGRVLSTTLVASDMFSTGEVDQANVYMLDPRNGANPLTIHGGHILDALADVLGEFADLSAVTATSRPEVTVRGTGERLRSASPDQIAIVGMLEGGAVASVHIRAGQPLDAALTWEIQGDRGALRVRCDPVFLHWLPLAIEGAEGDGPFRPLDPPLDRAFAVPPSAIEGPSLILAQQYAAFAEDIRTGSRSVAGFGEAVTRHRLLDQIQSSAEAFATGAGRA